MFRFEVYVTNQHNDLDVPVNKLISFLESNGNIKDKSNPDIVFVFGGDGSLLNAIKMYSNALTSFMMINAGTLGFYKEYELGEIDKLINEFNFDKLIREEHHLIEIADSYGNRAYAVNEIVLASSIKTLNINTYINDKYLMSVKGSGICIATPFGSSGYNHSLGGSLLVGDHGIVVSLLAPIHNKSTHPLINSIVMRDNDQIKIEVKSDSDFELAGDMRNLDNLQGTSFTIYRSKRVFCLAHTRESDAYQRIKQAFLD